MEISEEVLKFFDRKDVQDALLSNNMKTLYELTENLPNLVIGELTSILMQAGVDPLQGMTEIPESFLYGQENITEFNIPQGIVKIGFESFQRTSLKSISIPDSVREIEDWAFIFCGDLKAVRLPAGIKLGSQAFCSSGIESVELVDAELDGDAFGGCFFLKNAVIKGSTRKLPCLTFSGCSKLEHVELPVYLEAVGRDAFFLCKNLREVNFEGTADQWKHVMIHEDNVDLFSCKINCSDGTLRYDEDVREWVVVLR